MNKGKNNVLKLQKTQITRLNEPNKIRGGYDFDLDTITITLPDTTKNKTCSRTMTTKTVPTDIDYI